MADAYCKYCGEPWDIYEFHDIATQYKTTYQKVSEKFRANGCGLFDGAWATDPEDFDQISRCKTPEDEACASPEFRAAIGAVQDMSVHLEDAVSDIEDFIAVGLIK